MSDTRAMEANIKGMKEEGGKRKVYLAVIVRRDKTGNFLREIELGPFYFAKIAEEKARASARSQDDWAVDVVEQFWSEQDQLWLAESVVTLKGTMIP